MVELSFDVVEQFFGYRFAIFKGLTANPLPMSADGRRQGHTEDHLQRERLNANMPFSKPRTFIQLTNVPNMQPGAIFFGFFARPLIRNAEKCAHKLLLIQGFDDQERTRA